MVKILLISDVHLMNNPNDLTEDQIRRQWAPYLMTKKWMSYSAVYLIINYLRNTSLKIVRKLRQAIRHQNFDYYISLGDQCHGIAERGIEGEAGRKIAREFLRLFEPMTKKGPLLQVPSEHPLGYWEGVDYFPHLKWEKGPKIAIEMPRDIGGRLSLQAIANWQELFGPLWGCKEIGKFKLMWLDCDLIRWKERITNSNEPELQNLLRQQSEFNARTLSEAQPGQVILFTHRANIVFQDDSINTYRDKLKAVVFGDYHFEQQAREAIKRFPRVNFDWFFVPALWGVQFGIGRPSFGILKIDCSSVKYKNYTVSSTAYPRPL